MPCPLELVWSWPRICFFPRRLFFFHSKPDKPITSQVILTAISGHFRIFRVRKINVHRIQNEIVDQEFYSTQCENYRNLSYRNYFRFINLVLESFALVDSTDELFVKLNMNRGESWGRVTSEPARLGDESRVSSYQPLVSTIQVCFRVITLRLKNNLSYIEGKSCGIAFQKRQETSCLLSGLLCIYVCNVSNCSTPFLNIFSKPRPFPLEISIAIGITLPTYLPTYPPLTKILCFNCSCFSRYAAV